MKPFYSIVLLLLIPLMGLRAQKPIIVSEDSLKIGISTLPAIMVTIPEVSYDKALKDWIKLLQTGTKSKVVTENAEMSIFGAKIKDISENPVNVYSKFENGDSAIYLLASIELKKDQYIESATGEADFVKANNFMKEFAKSQYLDLAKDQADAEEKKLRDLQKELSSLENEKSRMHKSIQNGTSTIASEKESIVAQNNEITTVAAALVEHNALLATMEESPAKKEKVQYIKELEKRQKKAENSIQSSENKINRANSDIDKANSEIPRNEKMQDRVKEQIAEQEAVYQKYADKLKNIKSL